MKKLLIGVVALAVAGLTACGSGPSTPQTQPPAATPTFSITDKAATVVNNGSATSTSVSIVRSNGHAESINFAVTGLPTGMNVIFTKNPVSSTETTAPVEISAVNVPLGEYKLTVTGKSQTLSATAKLTVTVVASSTTIPDVAYVSAAANSTSVSVMWSNVTNATGYKLDRKTESGTYSEIATSTATTYTDTNVTTGTRYIYRVRTITVGGISSGKESPIVTFTGTPGGSGTTCCKICRNSKPCGDTCIAYDKTCHTPGGCACAGRSITFVKIKDCPIVTVNALGEEVKVGTVESWLKDRALLSTK